MKSFIREFKEFAVKGNMIDMAVAVVIGTAFNKVVSTLVKKVIMPPLSLLTEDVALANRKFVLRESTDTAEEVAIGYGEMIEVLIDFFIIALTIFMVVKGMNRFKKKAEDPKDKEVVTPKEIELLSKIEEHMAEQSKLLREKKS